MSKRYGNLAVRTLTTLVGGGGVLWLLRTYPDWTIWILSAFVAVGLAAESGRLLFESHGGARALMVCLAFAAVAADFVSVRTVLTVALLGLPLLSSFFLFRAIGQNSGKHMRVGQELFAAIFIWAFLILPTALLPSVVRQVQGADLFLVFLLTIWANDIGAYLVGSLLGRTLLAPAISPKKTVEGSLGGLVCAVGVAALTARLLKVPVELSELIVVSLAFGVLGQVGDLIESFVKRAASEKDSGNLIPGHGGVWDRFDSFVFCLPLWYIWVLSRADHGWVMIP